MKKIVVIPDSFKGTLPSMKACEILGKKAKEIFPDSAVLPIPVADGGEGTVDCFLFAMKGKVVPSIANDPYGKPAGGYLALIGDKAVVEISQTAGLSLVEGHKDPLKTSTVGLGQQIRYAMFYGAKEIIVGLGGSCTNDFGCGAAAALGVKFFDKKGESFIPVGGTLKNIERIDLSEIKTNDIKITAMCDVDNPPYGENGAAYVYGPQKGADEKAVKELDDGVKHVCDILKRDYDIDVSDLRGGGAAGAAAAGLKAFVGAELKPGIQTILDMVELDEKIKDADLIVTGEGKIDGQSLCGKVISGVAERAKKAGVPVVAIVGGADGDMKEIYDAGVTAVFPINRLPQDFSVSRENSEENLSRTAEDVFRLIKTMQSK